MVHHTISNSVNAVAENGVDPAGLITTGQPANAGATFLVIIAEGKFQVIIPHTPIDCLIVRIRLSDNVDGIVLP